MLHLGGLEKIPKTVSRCVKKSPERCITLGGVGLSCTIPIKASRFVSHYEQTAVVDKSCGNDSTLFSDATKRFGWRGSNSLQQVDVIAPVVLPIELHPILFASLT